MVNLIARKHSPWSYGVYGFIVIFISISQITPIPSPKFQDGNNWSPPQIMPGFDKDSRPPILIADQNRTVHAFSSQQIYLGNDTATRAIVYNQWTAEYGWTEPVDIILSPIKEARITDAYLDNQGFVSILFWGGDNTYANIYYLKAPLEMAGYTSAWSEPIIVTENAGDPEGAVFFENNMGELYVIFNSRQGRYSLRVVKSIDGGVTWSESIPIFFNNVDVPNTAQLKVVKGESGWIHVVWGVFDDGGQGRGIYYAKTQNGEEWSEPILLAFAAEGYGTQTPTIIEYNNILFFFYSGISMRQSTNNGEIWNDPVQIFTRHVGVNGPLSLVVDNNNTLHLFFGQRISGSPDIHGMWHSTFKNNRWSEPEAIIKGPRIVDIEGQSGFDPYFAQAVVSQGNLILLTWMTDPGAGYNGVWYSFKRVNAPELPVVELSIDESHNEDTDLVDIPMDSILETTIPTQANLENIETIPTSTDRKLQLSPGIIILTGSLLSLIIILIVVTAFSEKQDK